MPRSYTCLSVLAAVLIPGGCGNPDAPNVSGSMEKASIKGSVTVRGKKVKGGQVSFRAMNINRPNVPLINATIEPDGTYKAEPLIGENFVEASGKEITGGKNRDLIENEQPVKIRAGEQILDIELPSHGPLEPK